MEKQLTEIFKKAKYQENTNLSENIWQAIAKHNKHIIRLKLWTFFFISFASLVGIIPAWNALSLDLTHSGLYEYFSLIFSNNGSILLYWKELLFSLAESLPTISIIISFSLIFIFFLSLKYATKQIIKDQLSLSF
ncbi:MAG: hypothetical protein WC839_03540 [Candidatus Paceibacterota bacterium]